MKRMITNLLLGAAACGGTFQAIACTGIALTAADGAYVQARTIEWPSVRCRASMSSFRAESG